MMVLIIGLIVFLGVHLVPTLTGTRARLTKRLGEGPYKGAFSLAAAVGLVLVIWGFRQAPFVPVWEPPVWTRHLAALLMIAAAILVAAAYIPGRIKARLRHPFLAGVKIWALAHLIANGDAASILLFGSFLAYAVYDRVSLKGREARGLVTVTTAGPARNDAAAVLVGLALYAVIAFWLHPLLGPPVIPAG